jgi:hypothetical protein
MRIRKPNEERCGGEVFLSENKKKEGIKTTASGFAIQGAQGRDRSDTEIYRFGHDQLPWHID